MVAETQREDPLNVQHRGNNMKIKILIILFLSLMIAGCVSSNNSIKNDPPKTAPLQIDTVVINKKINKFNHWIDSLKSKIDSLNTREIK